MKTLLVAFCFSVSFVLAQPSSLVIQTGHFERGLSIDISKDGNFVATGSKDHSIVIWDNKVNKQLFKLNVHSAFVYALKFHPTQPWLLFSGDWTGKIYVTDLSRTGPSGLPESHLLLTLPYAVTVLDISADGNFALAGCSLELILIDLVNSVIAKTDFLNRVDDHPTVMAGAFHPQRSDVAFAVQGKVYYENIYGASSNQVFDHRDDINPFAKASLNLGGSQDDFFLPDHFIKSVKFSNNGSYIAYNNSFRVYVRRLSDFGLFRTFDYEDVSDIVFSDDGEKIIAVRGGSFTNKFEVMKLWPEKASNIKELNLRTGIEQEYLRADELFQKVSQRDNLIYTTGYPALVLDDLNDKTSSKGSVDFRQIGWNIDTRKSVKSLNGSILKSVPVDLFRNKMGFSLNGKMAVLEFGHYGIFFKDFPQEKGASELKFENSENLITSNLDELTRWNLFNFDSLRSIKSSRRIPHFAKLQVTKNHIYAIDGTFLDKDPVIRFDKGSLVPLEEIQSPYVNALYSVSFDENFVAIGGDNKEYEPKYVDFAGKEVSQQNFVDFINTLMDDHANNKVRSEEEYKKIEIVQVRDTIYLQSSLMLYDLKNSRPVFKKDFGKILGLSFFNNNSSFLGITNKEGLSLLTIPAGDVIRTFPDCGEVFSIFPDNKRVAYVNRKNEIVIAPLSAGANPITLGTHVEPIKKLGFIQIPYFGSETSLLVSFDDFGLAKIWDPSTNELIYNLVITEEDILLVDKNNYYFSLQGNFDPIAYRIGARAYPFEQFDLKYNRPDIVLSAIGLGEESLISSYYRAYQKRLERLNFTEEMLSDDFQVPKIEVYAENIPASVQTREISFRVNAKDDRYNLDRLNVWVNDVPIYGLAGINLRGRSTKTWEQNLIITLSQGENKVQVSVLNQGGAESLKETFYVTYNPAQTRAPDLYLITIGAQTFDDPQFNLEYPRKDLQDLAQLYQSQRGRYNNIFVERLFDGDVTFSNLRRLKQRLRGSKVDDQVIMFVAGHGVLDQNLDYYFAPSDMDFQHPAFTGIPFEALESLLDGIPARQKLFLMDACFSGEVDKGNTTVREIKFETVDQVKFRSFEGTPNPQHLGLDHSFELMKQLFIDLRRGSGATVISSAGGVEFAWEGDEWQNSVFTYCLLSGLKEYKADSNRDGKIMVSELRDYLTTEVPKWTGNHQRPTMRVENISNDWRVW